MKRRKFIWTTALAGLAAGSLSSMMRPRGTSVTILHTNDTHSRIDPFPADHKDFPGQGGVSRRLAMIEEIRQKEQHVLLFDSGDIFQGTPYFNLYKGEVEMKAMSAMGYDAATMGNHDFDAGLEGFVSAMKFSEFPFLCANYNFSDTVLHGKTAENKIFEKGGIRIGVFGLGVELKGLVAAKLFGNTRYLDPVSIANDEADYLKNEMKCQLVICLSHLGYHPKMKPMCDKLLAAETKNIDLIIGAHTHTFLQSPEIHQNAAGKPVLINQVGWAGLVLGRIDFFFDKNSILDDEACLSHGKNLWIS